MTLATSPMKVRGIIRVPGDKSISHRSLMLAALATGSSRITGILESADVHSTASVLRALGVDIPRLSSDFVIHGVGLHGLKAPRADLDCGNSGTSVRLLAGIAAAQRFSSTFVGDASLSSRPMRRIATPLTEMGASVRLPDHGGLPMTITGGRLRSIDYFSETSSAQVKSAILLAACAGGVPASVTEPIHSRDHTERMLFARGVHVHLEHVERGFHIHIAPVDALHALDTDVPGDPSSATFFAGLAALASDGEIELANVGMNPARTGAFAVLSRMGAVLTPSDHAERGGEPIATLRVAPGKLVATSVGGTEIPTLLDELPLIACVAARAHGETVITGAAELRVKESDRIATVVHNLKAIGAQAEELPDGLRVTGGERPLSGRVVTHGDHRIAMAFAVLGAVPGNRLEIDDRDCVGVSYPSFWSDLASIVSK
jgi:3-phosphoshikimate 1-carboxyvinyltransferase